MDIKDKKITVVGMGKSGMATVRVLNELGAQVVANDMKDAAFIDKDFMAFLEEKGIASSFGQAPSLEDVDMLALSPGVPTDLPFVQEAYEKNIEVAGELELAYRVGKGKYLAITGTNGKTTTTTLVGEIVANAGLDSVVVGNIGIAAIEKTIEATDDTFVVTEVSSFQLETTKEFKPMVSAILNVTPDHLDRHKTMENYAAAKAKVFANQEKDSYVVVNFDDKLALSLTTKGNATVVPFSRKEEMMFGACVKNDEIVIVDSEGKDHALCNIDELKIPGTHNLENALAAAAITYFAGVDEAVISKTLKEFDGVEHRIEFCGEVDGVRYINDSKGTNTDAAIKAIEAMKSDTIIIAGGYDKGSDYEDFIKAFEGKVTHAVLIGVTAVKIKDQAEKLGFTNTIMVADMEAAVAEAARLAKPGDNVLLSPACASWDMYKNYEERGNHFKQCVANLKK